jgi:hypothetical protein
MTGRLIDDDGLPPTGVTININYENGQFGPRSYFPFVKPTLNRDGRFRIEGLIPGVRDDLATRDDQTARDNFASGLNLQPGETRDLGDVRVKSM